MNTSAAPVPVAAARPRFRLATPRTVVVLGGVVLVLAGCDVFLSVHLGQSLASGSGFLVVAFAAVGALVAWRKPGNAIGWSMLGAGGFLVASEVAGLYSVLDYRHHAGGLPLGWLAVLVEPAWAPAILLFALSVVLFPDGALPSGRWRWPVAALATVGTIWLLGAFAIAADSVIEGTIRIEPSGGLVAMDHAAPGWAWWQVVQTVFFLLLAAVGLAWLVSRVPAYRRATGERRQQLKWLVAGGMVAVVGGVATVLLSNSTGVLGFVGRAGTIGLLGIPLAIGVGILRYRLYDIDHLISRTLSYALLTGALAAVFVGLVLLTTRVLPFSSPVGVAASTLVAAALFTPLRSRLQRLVDRRFNRARYDADALVAAFGLRLRDAVDLDTVRLGLLETAGRAVEPSHISVWLKD
ncbi:MAG TPA: hypothetical protein VH063_18310 [Gaiellaceae bacterium]|nr:hypothetical protein [Gaiellaceae bacterium]